MKDSERYGHAAWINVDAVLIWLPNERTLLYRCRRKFDDIIKIDLMKEYNLNLTESE
jgi:hypothetical protein